jgi:hypothetical protein
MRCTRLGFPPARGTTRAVVLGAAAVLAGFVGGLVPVRATEPEEAGQNLVPVEERLRERPDQPPVRLLKPLPSVPPASVEQGPFTSVQVNVDRHGGNLVGDAANEPSIAVDPNNPNHIAIGWRQFDSALSNFRQAGAAYSDDGGHTWASVGPLDPGVFRSDPVLAAGPHGNFAYSSLTGDFNVSVFTSTTGGSRWGYGVPAWGGDKQWLIVDRTTSSGRGNIYQNWNVTYSCCSAGDFTRSTDEGASFEMPVGVPGNPYWGTMDVAADGTLYVAGVNPANSMQILVAKSVTMQHPAYLPYFESTSTLSLGGRVQAGLMASPNPEGLLGQVWVAVDRSTGPQAGWVYVLASVDPPGTDPLDVMFARSTDGGQTWSAPVRINTVGDGWQWFGTMSVAPNGRIDVVWNDTRPSGDYRVSTLYYATSMDGGTTWSQNVAMGPGWNSHLGWPQQNKIGDYYHMVSDVVGADLAYAATYNGEQDVWFLRIGDYDCNANGIADVLDIAQRRSTDWNYNGIPDECENLRLSDSTTPAVRTQLLQNVPNPCNPATRIPFDLAVPGHVAVRLFDVAGRPVRTLGLDAHAGRNEVRWDGTDDAGRPVAAGIYVYRLAAPGFTATRRLAVVR